MAKPDPTSTKVTYAEYLTWPEWPKGERYEIHDGVPVAMSPAPGPIHQLVSMALTVQIGNALNDHPCRIVAAPLDVRLAPAEAKDDEIGTVVQPDLAVVCNDERFDRRGYHGAPEWIIEIISPTSAARDQIQKRALYEEHGVGEYWLVHPQDRLVWVYRLGEDGRYDAPQVLEMKGTLDATLGVRVDWDAVVQSLPSQFLPET